MQTLDAAVFPYLVILLLWAVIGLFGASIVALFIGLGLHKREILRRIRTRQERIARFEGILARSGTDPAVRLPVLHELEEVTALGSALTRKFGPDAIASPRILELIRASGAEKAALQELGARDWARRYQAVTAIGDLRLPELFDPLVEFARTEENMRIFGICLFSAAHLLSKPFHFQVLFTLAASRPDLSAGYDEGTFRIAIRTLMERGVAPERLSLVFQTCLEAGRAGEQHALALIQAIGKERLLGFRSLLVQVARERASDRLTAATLRSLQSMAQCDPLIEEQIGAADLMLNIAALRSAESCGEAIVPRVSAQLASPDFNVRYAAAQTLMNLGEAGHRELLAREQDAREEVRHMAVFALLLESR